MKASPLFSVVICTYQRYDMLRRVVESVLAQDIEPEAFDIWVMDNSPASPLRATNKGIYEAIPRLHYIEIDTPGLSNARNLGIEMSTGEFIVFLDDDAVAAPTWLRSYREAFAQLDERVGAIGGRAVPHFEAPRPAWLIDELLIFYSLADWFPDIHELPESLAPLGVNAALRRKAIESDNRFPTALGRRGKEADSLLSGEEEDLFRRLREQGWTLWFAPKAEVTHHISANRLSRAWLRRRMVWQTISNQIRKPILHELDQALWVHIVGYLKKLPSEQTPLMGLCWDTEDPALFREQLCCLQFLIYSLLSAGEYPPNMRFGVPPEPVKEVLKA
jgi:glycosyltransferase involved in cell wall biosynthesis